MGEFFVTVFSNDTEEQDRTIRTAARADRVVHRNQRVGGVVQLDLQLSAKITDINAVEAEGRNRAGKIDDEVTRAARRDFKKIVA